MSNITNFYIKAKSHILADLLFNTTYHLNSCKHVSCFIYFHIHFGLVYWRKLRIAIKKNIIQFMSYLLTSRGPSCCLLSNKSNALINTGGHHIARCVAKYKISARPQPPGPTTDLTDILS